MTDKRASVSVYVAVSHTEDTNIAWDVCFISITRFHSMVCTVAAFHGGVYVVSMTDLSVSYTRYTASVASECTYVVSSIKQATATVCLENQLCKITSLTAST